MKDIVSKIVYVTSYIVGFIVGYTDAVAKRMLKEK